MNFKYLIILILSTLSIYSSSKAQTFVCSSLKVTPSKPQYPDTLSNLPAARKDSFYNEGIQFYAPTNITTGAPISLVKLDSVVGLPAGFSFSTNPSNGQILAGQAGCLFITSQKVITAIGDYNLKFYFSIILTSSVKIPYTVSGYKLRIRSQNIPDYVSSNGLVGWWPFSGNSIDSSGNGNDLNNIGSVTYGSDRLNKSNSAPILNGIGQYFSRISPNLFSGNSPYTIAFWYKSVSVNSQGAIQIGVNGGCNSSTTVFINDSTKFINVKCAGNIGGGDISTNEINTWKHFYIVYNVLGFQNTYVISDDGKTLGIPPGFYPPNLEIVPDKINIGLGYDFSQVSMPIYPKYFIGSIDDVGIWNRALTGEEISKLSAGCSLSSINLVTNGTKFCQGESLLINSNYSINSNKYTWLRNDTILDNESLPSLNATQAGIYKLKVENSYCSRVSQPITISTILKPNAGQIAGSINNLQTGTSYLYNINQQIGLTYNWLVNNAAIISGQGTNAISVQWLNNGYGKLTCVVTNSEGCRDTSFIIVGVGNSPGIVSLIPKAAGKGTIVTISGFNLNNATAVKFGDIDAQSFNVVNSGQIRAVVGNGGSGEVTVTTPNGTTTIPGFTFLSNTGIQSVHPLDRFIIYPNPANDKLTIKSTNQKLNESNIIIYDLIGRKVLEENVINPTSEFTISLSELKPGTYFLFIQNEANNNWMKFVKE